MISRRQSGSPDERRGKRTLCRRWTGQNRMSPWSEQWNRPKELFAWFFSWFRSSFFIGVSFFCLLLWNNYAKAMPTGKYFISIWFYLNITNKQDHHAGPTGWNTLFYFKETFNAGQKTNKILNDFDGAAMTVSRALPLWTGVLQANHHGRKAEPKKNPLPA